MAKKTHRTAAASRLTKVSRKAKIGTLIQAEVKRRRESLGLSLSAAAKAAGFKSSIQWWDLENKPARDPRVSTLAKVAAALRCSVDDLLGK